ncbi:phytochrome, two-component sensor histidine kinase [hydrocarbon metagenome]|uniref:histidine kinase n=1 Tax=hydrocarbon metagenome TaxID=938273 RepID=A0A0W8FV12_9ZZZZ
MILLDMKTIVFSNLITDIVCLVVIILLWQQNRKRFSGTELFVFDFALQTAALFMIVARGRIPDWASMVLSNTMVIAGALLGYIGLTHFAGKKSSQAHNYVLLAAFALIHAYFTFVQPDLAARNLNLALALLIICWQCTWLMLYRIEPEKRMLTRGVGFVFAAYCMVSVIRIVDYFTVIQTTSNYFQSGIFAQLIMISYQMLFLLLTYALVLMFNKTLLTDVKTQEEKFSKAFHSSPYAIMITRLTDGQIIEVNEGFSNITGYQRDEVRGKTTPALHLWDKDEDRALVVNELSTRGKLQQREFPFRKKSGEVIIGLFSAEIIMVNNEKCILSSIDNITARKRAENYLRESEEKYRSITENMSDGISELDPQGIIKYISPSVERILGYNKEELIGSSAFDLVHPEDRDLVISTYMDGVKTQSEREMEQRYRRKDGTYIWLRSSGHPLYESTGEHIGMIVNSSDITERKLAEDEIRRLNAELEQKIAERTKELRNSQLALLNLVEDLNQSVKDTDVANKKLEEANTELAAFSYSVSHDLRAPLRSIDGFSLALLEDYQAKLDDKGRNYLHRIRAATQHMGMLIEDMLKLSRIIHTELHTQSIDLSELFREIITNYQEKNSVRIVDTIIKEDISIKGDFDMMHIVLTNLIENALKFTGKTAQPKIEFGTTNHDGKRLIFIRDNGVGFDMAYANKLFGAFQRLHSTDEFPGTGIGLATVKRIIIRHGGQIWAEGEVGKGAVFYFTLPE